MVGNRPRPVEFEMGAERPWIAAMAGLGKTVVAAGFVSFGRFLIVGRAQTLMTWLDFFASALRHWHAPTRLTNKLRKVLTDRRAYSHKSWRSWPGLLVLCFLMSLYGYTVLAALEKPTLSEIYFDRFVCTVLRSMLLATRTQIRLRYIKDSMIRWFVYTYKGNLIL